MHIIYIHISIPVSIHRQDICAQAHTCTHNLFQACSSFFLTLSPSLSHEDSALSCPSQHYTKSWLPWRQDIIRFSFMGSHILLSTHLINAISFAFSHSAKSLIVTSLQKSWLGKSQVEQTEPLAACGQRRGFNCRESPFSPREIQSHFCLLCPLMV